MLGREAPLEFFRRSGIPIRGEWRAGDRRPGFAAFLLVCVFLYNWKSGGHVTQWFQKNQLFPFNVPALLERAGGAVAAAAKNPATFLGTLTLSLTEPGFYYSFAYCLCVLLFGIARIRRRKTPYVTRQTITLTLIQWIPALPPALPAAAVARPQRSLRPRLRQDVRRPPLPRRQLRTGARVLAGVRLHPRVAALHLERLLVAADELVARRSASSRRS